MVIQPAGGDAGCQRQGASRRPQPGGCCELTEHYHQQRWQVYRLGLGLMKRSFLGEAAMAFEFTVTALPHHGGAWLNLGAVSTLHGADRG